MLLELKLKQDYTALVVEFQTAFPGIKPPAPEWFALWLGKHSFREISDAIHTLQAHPLKSRFTTESTGRAMSALLRESAVRRAFSSPAVKP
jgi:hypothetical protein